MEDFIVWRLLSCSFIRPCTESVDVLAAKITAKLTAISNAQGAAVKSGDKAKKKKPKPMDVLSGDVHSTCAREKG